MRSKFIGAAIGAAIIAAAFAASPSPAQDARVKLYRHELATVAGQQVVFSRINRAARNACTTGSALAESRARKACRTELVQQMVDQLGSPAITAMLDKGTVLAAIH